MAAGTTGRQTHERRAMAILCNCFSENVNKYVMVRGRVGGGRLTRDKSAKLRKTLCRTEGV